MGKFRRQFSFGAMALAVALPASAGAVDNPHWRIMGAVVVWGANANGTAPVVSDFIINSGTGTTAAASGDADLITGDVHTVVTGTLTATQDAVNAIGTMPFIITNTAQGNINTDTNGDGILNASDAFSRFGLSANSDTIVNTTRSRSSFFVASNTPFSIDARTFAPTTPLANTLMNITRLQLSSTVSGTNGSFNFGSAAQAAHTGGAAAGFTAQQTLAYYLPGRRIFTGNRRTAAVRGSLMEQSVRFDAVYTINASNLTGYDLSLGTFDFEVDVVYTVFVP